LDGIEVDDDVVRVIGRKDVLQAVVAGTQAESGDLPPVNPVIAIDWNVEERGNPGMGAGHTAPWFYGSIKVSGHGGRHDDAGAVRGNRPGAHDRFNVASSGANA
jgi:hypothetical protein